MKILFGTRKFTVQFSTFGLEEESPPFQKLHSPLEGEQHTTGQKHPLITKLEDLVNANLENEQFCVGQLAEMVGMSRSHLHRKLQKINGKSISRFIREYRLKKAREMLLEKELTASEVAHAVGFGSPSYFGKCFTEYFGYSPGKARFRDNPELVRLPRKEPLTRKGLLWIIGGLLLFLTGGAFFVSGKKEVTLAKDAPTKNSIVVLPFKNLSSEDDNRYLADGMVDAINRNLSDIEELEVFNVSAGIPVSSVQEVGKKLNVSNVLSGSIQQQDSTLRLEVRLIETSSGKQLWANKYDSKVLDVLRLQNEIAIKVAEALESKIVPQQLSMMQKRSSYDPEAYDSFLKGFYHCSIFSPMSQERGFEYLTKALEKDSTIAAAHLGLATYYHVKASMFFAELSAKEAMKKARPHIEKALALDPGMVETHGWRGYQYLYNDWNFEKAERGYRLTVEKDVIMAYNAYIDLLNYEHRHEEALEICNELDKRHPFYPNNRFMLTYYYLGRFMEGKKQMETRLELYPNDYMIFDNALFFTLNTGDYDRGIELYKNFLNSNGKRFPRMLGWVGACYVKKGDIESAKGLLSELKEWKKRTDAGSPSWFIAVIYSALGEKKEALKWIETAINDHEMEVPWLVSEPQFYSLHGMPEFDALVKRVGFREHSYPVRIPKHAY